MKQNLLKEVIKDSNEIPLEISVNKPLTEKYDHEVYNVILSDRCDIYLVLEYEEMSSFIHRLIQENKYDNNELEWIENTDNEEFVICHLLGGGCCISHLKGRCNFFHIV